MKNASENFHPEKPKDEIIRTVVIDKLKRNNFGDIIILKKRLQLTKEEIECFGNSKKIKIPYMIKLKEIINNRFTKTLKVFSEHYQK